MTPEERQEHLSNAIKEFETLPENASKRDVADWFSKFGRIVGYKNLSRAWMDWLRSQP